MKFRPYQIESITKLRQDFATHKRQLLCLPTGAGKTVVFSEIARLAAIKNTPTLILTDRVELFKQTFKALSRTGHTIHELKAASKSTDYEGATIVLGMVETLKRRTLENFNPKLIIVDEAHKGNFTKVFDKYPDAQVIGATATPVGKHIPKYYTNIVQEIDTPDLVGLGFLAPCKAYQMQDNFDDLEVKRGDYTEQSQYAHFNKARLYSGVVDKWKEYGNNQKTIVFNVNIEHAEKQTAEFNRAGVESYCITSKTPTKEREKILADFTAGAFPVLNNCGILTTGYDEPSIKVVIVNRKTKSLPLWLQCVGRGSRTYPGKESFLLLDFGQNHNEHGLWSTERTWTIEQPKKKKKEQAAPVKDCPGCGAMLYANTRLCPYCNMTIELKAIYNEKTGVMVEVLPSSIKGRKLSSLSINELIKVQKLGEVKAAMVWRVVRSHGLGAVKQYAKAAGYSNGWVYRQKKEINNCTFYDKII